MSRNQMLALAWLVCFGVFFPQATHAILSNACQAAQTEQHQHQTNVSGTADQKCDPHFTYTPGPHDPSHWEGACNTGHVQSPIDIQNAERASLAPLNFHYQPVALNILNDCDHYRIQVKFPENDWLKVGKTLYTLNEFHFHEPGENAVNGKRPVMVIHLVHRSSESSVLVVEVPVVVGKENPTIKTLWEHIPPRGKEQKFEGVKINAADLLPADHSFYKFPGSLTTPLCTEGVAWYVLKNPIEVSAAQVAEYMTHYHNTARPLQPLNGRPVQESK
jgi:carbonic anhydrase